MLKTVSFYGSCAAGSVVTLCSQPITHPFRVKKIRAKFADGCVNAMRVEFILAGDKHAPATGRPNGISILSDYGQVDYVVGNNEVVELQHEVDVREGNTYVKVYADNRDFNAHDVLAQITIDSVERR